MLDEPGWWWYEARDGEIFPAWVLPDMPFASKEKQKLRAQPWRGRFFYDLDDVSHFPKWLGKAELPK